MESGSDLLTVVEAAQFLRVSRSTLNKWRLLHNYGPRFTRIGRRIFYRRADLMDYIRRNVFESTSAYQRLAAA